MPENAILHTLPTARKSLHGLSRRDRCEGSPWVLPQPSHCARWPTRGCVACAAIMVDESGDLAASVQAELDDVTGDAASMRRLLDGRNIPPSLRAGVWKVLMGVKTKPDALSPQNIQVPDHDCPLKADSRAQAGATAGRLPQESLPWPPFPARLAVHHGCRLFSRAFPEPQATLLTRLLPCRLACRRAVCSAQ